MSPFNPTYKIVRWIPLFKKRVNIHTKRQLKVRIQGKSFKFDLQYMRGLVTLEVVVKGHGLPCKPVYQCTVYGIFLKLPKRSLLLVCHKGYIGRQLYLGKTRNRFQYGHAFTKRTHIPQIKRQF